MGNSEWARAPIGMDAGRWTTWGGCRRVLAVACMVADAQRLMDPVATVASDPRVQVVFTVAPDQVFGAGLAAWLARAGVVVVPWQQAVNTRFDLALAASASRVLDRVHAPVVLFSHGVGFNKLTPAHLGGQGLLARATYGLGREGLVRDGRLVAERIALAHDDEALRLASACPEAVGGARVVGDAAADRILASLERRPWCRSQLGLGPDDVWVVAASTWGPSSLLGSRRTLLGRLVVDAVSASCRVGLLVHPNVWAAHGAWQVHQWLGPLIAQGLEVVPVDAEWASALAAADAVVGDHGSTTVYATLTGRPVLVADDGRADVDTASPMGQVLRTLPAVRGDAPLVGRALRSVEAAEREALRAVAARITSHPGRFAQRTRAVLYEVLGLDEPDILPAARPLRPLGWDMRGWAA
ncbi:hypothetical protein [Nocardiopsis sp. TNDT3]|uniref:hypothetical protein n=1 Tax=Nocardiopsis sp. TNDT3 TaxID=2249354 RepID=UPI000E3C775E|nr:hypothetical protein [Nocardiopsis sp. TNDT3]